MYPTKTKYSPFIQLQSIGAFLYGIERRMTLILTFLIVISVVMYVFFLGSSIYYTVERSDVLFTLTQRNSNIAVLDNSYLKKRAVITATTASQLGFVSLNVEKYVERAQYLGRADTLY